MKNPIKKFAMLQGKKRYIFLALLVGELLSLPAAAQIMQRVSFDIRPVVTAVEIPTAEPGLSRYLVASNAGFTVEATNLIGNVNIDVHTSGALGGGNRFGDAAQLPGPKTGCAIANGLASNIYFANEKTAAVPGTPPEQAVVFELRYASEANPKFKFIADSKSKPVVEPCSNAAS